MHTTLIYSREPGNGTTTAAVGLAVTLATAGKRVLYLDATHWLNSAHRFGIHNVSQPLPLGQSYSQQGISTPQPVAPHLDYSFVDSRLLREPAPAVADVVDHIASHGPPGDGPPIDHIIIDSHAISPADVAATTSFLAVAASRTGVVAAQDTPPPDHGVIISSTPGARWKPPTVAAILSLPIAATIPFSHDVIVQERDGTAAAGVPHGTEEAFATLQRIVDPTSPRQASRPRLRVVPSIHDDHPGRRFTR